MASNNQSSQKDDKVQKQINQSAEVGQSPLNEFKNDFTSGGIALENQVRMMTNPNIPVMQRQTIAQNIGNTLGNQTLSKAIISRSAKGVIQRQSSISQEDRDWLYDRITFRMSTAYTNFANACDQVAGEINAQVAANKAFVGTLAGIALGYLSPVASAGIGSLIDNIPNNARDSIYHAALYLTDNNWAWQGTYNALTLTAKNEVVDSLGSGDSSTTDYIEVLKQSVLEQFDDIHGSANSLNDQQLLALFTAYDPSYATQPAYAQQIRTQATHFQTQVIDQGVDESWRIDGPNIKEITRLFGVRIGNGYPIATIAQRGGFSNAWEIIEWVTPDTGMEAVQESILMYGEIPVVPDGTMDINLIGSSAHGPSYRLPEYTPTKEYADPDEIRTPNRPDHNR